MTWTLKSVQLLLACLCYSQGALTALAYTHKHSNQLLIFMIGSFVLGLSSSFSIFFESLTVFRLLQHVSFAFFFASTVVLVVFLTSTQGLHFQQLRSTSLHSPILLTLALVTILVVGLSLGTELTCQRFISHATDDYPHDPESETADWQPNPSHVDELSLNKSHKASFQPPIVHLELDRDSLSDKTLRNKDSEGTLVVPIMTREDEVSLNWLIQASKYTSPMYDNDSENWMNSKPLGVGICNIDSLKQSVVRKPPKVSSSGPPLWAPKVRMTRSNTTGSLRASPSPREPLHKTLPLKIQRSVSLSNFQAEDEGSDSLATTNISEPSTHNHITEESNDALVTDFTDTQTWLGEHRKRAPNRSSDMKDCAQDKIPLSSSRAAEGTKSRAGFFHSPGDSSQFPLSMEDQYKSLANTQQYLYPAFEHSSNCISGHSPATSSAEADILDGLESIPMAVPRWEQSNTHTNMKNVSLQEWETNKDQWLQLRNNGSPIFFSSGTHRKSTGSMSTRSAPSLHTYREQSEYGSKISTNSFSASNDTLQKCVTPPQQESNIINDHIAPDTSPIKKMIGRFKRKDSSVEIKYTPQKHKHSNSLANSMMSVASGISSRSGSPRKSRTTFFSRPSSEQQPKKLLFTKPATLLRGSNTVKDNASTNPTTSFYTDRFWDVEYGDSSDRSRVSSVPSAVIGEYDREKWRTMKELQKGEAES